MCQFSDIDRFRRFVSTIPTVARHPMEANPHVEALSDAIRGRRLGQPWLQQAVNITWRPIRSLKAA